MGRIGERFARLAAAGDGGLIVFVVGGHPTMEASLGMMLTVAEGGADVIEVGVPFSDPLADGPVIQAASQRALAEGATPEGVFELAARFRERRDTPLVLMTCYNPIWQYGLARYASACRAAGVDGVLVTDLPPEEAGDWVGEARREEVDTVFLIAPTTPPSRVKKVVDIATGFVYCVSRMGVTGARSDLPAELEGLVARVREQTEQPVAVGFGVSRAEQVAQVCRLAEAAVVGSAVVSVIDAAPEPGVGARAAARAVSELKAATRGTRRRG